SYHGFPFYGQEHFTQLYGLNSRFPCCTPELLGFSAQFPRSAADRAELLGFSGPSPGQPRRNVKKAVKPPDRSGREA
ncbi:hypothetical protein, partial [Paenibacillus pasadenensis]|uniref:hypothetical protein n=1 Tax=Paenibacillus pasadenensis TaxID=217090 RepID=UPI001C3F6DFC